MDTLKAIARRAMIEHDLLPDFSPAAVREATAMTDSGAQPMPEVGAGMRRSAGV